MGKEESPLALILIAFVTLLETVTRLPLLELPPIFTQKHITTNVTYPVASILPYPTRSHAGTLARNLRPWLALSITHKIHS